VRSVRTESGFYADSFLQFLEERSLPSSFIVVARLTTYSRAGSTRLVSQWQAIDTVYAVSEFRFKLWDWKAQRRFVVVREQIQTNKAAVDRKLIDLLGYRSGLCDQSHRFSPGSLARLQRPELP
jgi:hypothetical protein